MHERRDSMSHALVGKHPLVTGGGPCKAAIIAEALVRPCDAGITDPGSVSAAYSGISTEENQP